MARVAPAKPLGSTPAVVPGAALAKAGVGGYMIYIFRLEVYLPPTDLPANQTQLAAVAPGVAGAFAG